MYSQQNEKGEMKMKKEKLYARCKKDGTIGYIDNNMFITTFCMIGPYREQEYTFDVTATEIMKYQEEVERREGVAQEQERKEKELLSLCGLVPEDFVRFRGVSREGNELVVETRENGVSMRSVNAIRNVNYISSKPDEFDRTYEYYTFKIPETE
jgi:hypothetical protein